VNRLALLLLLGLVANVARAEEEAAPAPAPESPPPATEVTPLEDDWLFEDTGPDPAERDDMEGVNRFSFGFNEEFFHYLADPVARGFAWLVPAPGRRAIHRFFENLESPALFISDVFQLAPLDATKTTSRFVINSTIGIGGLFDPAGAMGIENHHTDFGETLAVWGTPSGSYVVIPLLGPSTARDTFGQVVDAALHPAAWLLTPVQALLLRTSGGLSEYDVERERLEALRATSVDFYAAIRGAYLMDRDAKVEQRRDTRWWHRQKPELEAAAE
jgi:phospholipid-binding lipoprotein MlaA